MAIESVGEIQTTLLDSAADCCNMRLGEAQLKTVTGAETGAEERAGL